MKSFSCNFIRFAVIFQFKKNSIEALLKETLTNISVFFLTGGPCDNVVSISTVIYNFLCFLNQITNFLLDAELAWWLHNNANNSNYYNSD